LIKYVRKSERNMDLYEVTLTLSIEAMHEESADTKLDNFLSALDLKKNEKIDLVDLGDLLRVGENGESDDTTKKNLPDLKMPEEEDWEDEWEELDWDSLDEESDDDDEESDDDDDEEDIDDDDDEEDTEKETPSPEDTDDVAETEEEEEKQDETDDSEDETADIDTGDVEDEAGFDEDTDQTTDTESDDDESYEEDDDEDWESIWE